MIENQIHNELLNENCNEKTTNKKIKLKTMVVVIVTVLVIIIGCIGAFSYAEVAKVNSQLKNGKINSAIEKVEKLSFTSKFIFKKSIEKQIEDCIKAKNYSSYEDGNLVYSKAIEDYRGYKEIIDILKFSAEESMVKYVDEVLKLSEYQKYNTISECIDKTSNTVFSALDSLKQGQLTYSSSIKTMYFAAACDYITSAEMSINGKKGYLVQEYSDGLNELKNGLVSKLQASINGSYDAQETINISNKITSGQNSILHVIEKLDGPSSDIEKIMKEIESMEKSFFSNANNS